VIVPQIRMFAAACAVLVMLGMSARPVPAFHKEFGIMPKVDAGGVPLTLTAADKVAVFALSWQPAENDPVILLFHQAGSGKSEFATIAPRLAGIGANVLAIDQRSGGDMYQPPNQTVEKLGKSESYMSALADMEAALEWAKRTHPQSQIYVLGSSYSAALVFLLAARHQKDVAAVLAFSPGEYLPDKRAVHNAAKQLRMPLFVDSSTDREEIESAKSILAASRSKRKVQHVPKEGVHGASTLRSDADPKGAEENWDATVAFLRTLSH